MLKEFTQKDALKEIVKGYMETALSTEFKTKPKITDLDSDSQIDIYLYCKNFFEKNRAIADIYICSEGTTWENFGKNFYLSTNFEGCGFIEFYGRMEEDIVEDLCSACKREKRTKLRMKNNRIIWEIQNDTNS